MTKNFNLSIKRKNTIAKILKEKGEISVSELVNKFSVSEVTIRRYLRDLERKGILLRTYGGAVKREDTIPAEFFFGEKSKRNINEKKRIASLSVKLIQNGQIIFLDTGTTTLEISKFLVKEEKKVMVVTNSIPIAYELASTKYIKVFILSGFFRKELFDLFGPFSIPEIEKFSFNQSFLGVDGISSKVGLTTTDLITAQIEEAVMDRSEVINIVADFSKIGRISFIPYGNIKNRRVIKRLITDSSASKDEIRKLKEYGFEIKIAL